MHISVQAISISRLVLALGTSCRASRSPSAAASLFAAPTTAVAQMIGLHAAVLDNHNHGAAEHEVDELLTQRLDALDSLALLRAT